jgi:hypothetical protein
MSMPNARREREEALIKKARSGSIMQPSYVGTHDDFEKVCIAIEAAHRREDAIRKYVDEMMSERFGWRRELITILDGDEVKG